MTEQPLPLFKTSYFQNQLREASDFYAENGGYNLAERFLSTVETALNRIAGVPYQGIRYAQPESVEELRALHYRMYSLKSFSPFPYTVYYEVEPERIVLQALYHQARARERL